MNTRQDIEQALQLLKNNGYYVDNLWSVDDVQSIFNCDSDTAQSVLNKALTNEHLMEEIWFQIRHHGEAMEIPYI
jgi:hypothetical protein